MFIDALRIQLILKGIITENDWNDIEETINIDFLEDNYFAELKEFEIMRERLEMAQQMDDLLDKGFISKKYVRQNVLKQSDEDMEKIDNEVEDEKSEDSEGEGDDLDF